MTQSERSIRTMGFHPGAIPEVGNWLWAMEEVRRGLLSTLARIEKAGFGQEFLDWRGPDGQDNSVGSLLYHIAGVELGWLYFDVMLGAAPDDLNAMFPVPQWDDHGKLGHVPGVPLSDHIAKLAEARRRFLEFFTPMSLEEWNELKSPPNENYSMTPAWTVFHLVEHESGHMYEIHRIVRKWLERAKAA